MHSLAADANEEQSLVTDLVGLLSAWPTLPGRNDYHLRARTIAAYGGLELDRNEVWGTPSTFRQSVGERRVAIGFTAPWWLLGDWDRGIAVFKGRNRF